MRHSIGIAACLVLLTGYVQRVEAATEEEMVQGCATQSEQEGGLSAAASRVLCQCSMDELKKTYSIAQISSFSGASAAEREEFGALYTEFVNLAGKAGERCFKDFSEKNP